MTRITLAGWLRALAPMLVVTLAACTSAPPAQPAAPQASALPPASAPAAAPPAWQTEWEQTVAAARQEGQVAVSGLVGEVWRNALLTFEKDYPGIKVEYNGVNSRDFWPRVRQEREAGHYLHDVRVGGADPEAFAAARDGILAPIRPLLVLPEVVDGSKWLGGIEGLFADTAKQYFVGFVAGVNAPVTVNRDVVSETDLRSDRELLDPRWKGRISMQDPRGGAAQSNLAAMLATYGESFVRELLLGQEVVVIADSRQQVEWLVRGRYPIAIGVAPAQLLHFQQQGLGQNAVDLEGVRALSVGAGGLQVLSRAPHPHAARVFVNWLLTAPVQDRVAAATQLNSRRLEVSPGDPRAVPDAADLDRYVQAHTEEFIEVKERIARLAAQYTR
jgi:ABC-type Fe3+ transport system substrate-binding protein